MIRPSPVTPYVPEAVEYIHANPGTVGGIPFSYDDRLAGLRVNGDNVIAHRNVVCDRIGGKDGSRHVPTLTAPRRRHRLSRRSLRNRVGLGVSSLGRFAPRSRACTQPFVIAASRACLPG